MPEAMLKVLGEETMSGGCIGLWVKIVAVMVRFDNYRLESNRGGLEMI